MSTWGDPNDRPDPAIWDHPVMRAALAERDIVTVYRTLKRHGISQRRIAHLTGQAQPEVSTIARGRQVITYDVLARIADGLGIPAASWASPTPPPRNPPPESRCRPCQTDESSWDYWPRSPWAPPSPPRTWRY
ncbi:helix-turn-helix domain-containing protein [Actinokineospora diospyrosa]|uniref:Helix-turn-helix domain-containing protein n=1 Tax=Actinokineospora diospyrosa TaxID=103728 RepID=A0ABT1I9I2_9PSEU|nr:helix-turn-helix transcriptional regulator [Actinokineospora diospyrosa]MCP2269295.1 Helix-turn-helix domain-containing protein [Actinokineospora diospyrosa]